ncbi:hypothetical protein [Oscillatoria sp. FACHB-1406]|uniref:hypothetical protein n=1 Tax=Oscillatoria sp. FACHB-1406 TaxID=2692846 RepID=UPI001685D665|nr:hypothetical protein [Oscillatoria sp. FACHB-1406]MBD2580336.1 hypothetical protein [Oscillatoria sp. FACHB-1406]
MATVLKKVWQVLRTDVRELLAPTEVAESGTEISKAALELGIALGLLVNPQSLAST